MSLVPGVTLEALSADEETMQHHYRSQPHRGKQELPWRKARTERRRNRQRQLQADSAPLAPPKASPTASALNRSYESSFDSASQKSGDEVGRVLEVKVTSACLC